MKACAKSDRRLWPVTAGRVCAAALHLRLGAAIRAVVAAFCILVASDRHSPAHGDVAESASLAGTTVRVRQTSDALLVPVCVEGTYYSFLFDTGATRSALDSSFRARLGKPVGWTRARTSGGAVLLDRFDAPRATLGGAPVVNLRQVVCADLSPSRDGTDLDIYGVLGMDVLRHERFRIDFDRGEIAFLHNVYEAGNAIPISFSRNGAPKVALTVDALGNDEFLIDTGCSGVGNLMPPLLDRLLRNRAAVPVRPTLHATVAGVGERRRARVREVSLGSFRHRGLIFDEAPGNSLGSGYLRRYVVTFDFPGGVMYLRPSMRFADPSRRGLSGARLWRPGGTTRVRFIHEGTPAEKAGLRVGDVIEELDGQPASSLQLSEIITRFSVRGEYRLTVARGERRLHIVLVLEDPHDPWQDPPIAFAPAIREAAKLSR